MGRFDEARFDEATFDSGKEEPVLVRRGTRRVTIKDR